MPDCCVQNCDNKKVDVVYFKFPLHDSELLEKWLKQIGILNWQPSEDNYICANHFASTDIINNPKRKYLVLKEGAIPTIFSNQTDNIVLKVEESKQSIMDDNIKSDNKIIPTMIQTTPIILTPAIVEPLTAMNSRLLSLSNTPQRFRKILPKTEDGVDIIQNKSTEKTDVLPNTSPKSYIIIIPTFNNQKVISAPDTPPKLPLPNNKKPILKITINRKYDNNPSLKKLKRNNDNDKSNSNIDTKCEKNRQDENDTAEEVIISHKTLNKSVVFSLDTISGEISLSYRDIAQKSGLNTKLTGTQMKLRENPPKRKIWSESEEMEDMYKRVKRDCSTLRTRLHTLRDKHQKETEIVEKLQKELMTLEKIKSVEKNAENITAKPAIDSVPKNQINVKILSNDKINSSNDKVIINKDLKLKKNHQNIPNQDNNNQTESTKTKNNSSLCKSIEQNGHYSTIEIDKSSVIIQTSNLETFNLDENIVNSTNRKDQSV